MLARNPAIFKKVFAAAGGLDFPFSTEIRFSHIYPLLGAFRTDSDGTFTVRFGVAIPHGRLQVSHIDPGGQNMTERFSYLAQTVILLYDGLFVGCQGAFVTSFGCLQFYYCVRLPRHPSVEGFLAMGGGLCPLYTIGFLYICFGVSIPKHSTFGFAQG